MKGRPCQAHVVTICGFVVLRPVTPWPKPRILQELNDWIFKKFSAHSSHSHIEDQLTRSLGGTQTLGSALPLSTLGWPGGVVLRPFLPESKAGWMEATRQLLRGQVHAQGHMPVRMAEPQAHQPLTQQSWDSAPNPYSKHFHLVLSFLRWYQELWPLANASNFAYVHKYLVTPPPLKGSRISDIHLTSMFLLMPYFIPGTPTPPKFPSSHRPPLPVWTAQPTLPLPSLEQKTCNLSA